MPAPTIPVYAGSTPNRNQAPEVFSVNADTWLAYQAPLPASYNALATYLAALAVDTEATLTGLVSQGQSLLTATEGFAITAQGAAEMAASSANFKGQWINLTGALNIPATVEHNGVLWILLNNLPDVTLSEPTSGNSDWLSFGTAAFADLTTSATDSTAGRMTKVGDFGIGATDTLSAGIIGGSANDIQTGGLYWVQGVTDLPVAENGFLYVNASFSDNSTCHQEFTQWNVNRKWYRTEVGTGNFTPWQEFFTTATPNVANIGITANATINRTAPVTNIVRTASGSPILTLGTGFVPNDVITIYKGRTVGSLTIDGASFQYPDGSIDTSAFIPAASSLAVSLILRGDGFWQLTVLG